MTEHFLNEIMKSAVVALCQSMGWNSAQTTTIDVLADVWRRQFLQIGKSAHRNAEHCGRSQVTLEDTALAFNEMGISFTELEEYIHNFDPVPLPYKVPNVPHPKESHLNFLRPGSAEVLTRPVHIHEYMPPWNLDEKKEKDSRASESGEVNGTLSQSSSEEVGDHLVIEEPGKEILENGTGTTEEETKESKQIKTEFPKDKDSVASGSPPPSSSGSSSFSTSPPKSAKRMESPGESPALKRVRMMLEEEGHPLRQISSVIMTTSGFLTSSREGRLPDAKPPKNRDFFEILPAPPVEKKKKIPTMKKIVEGVKKLDKDKDKDLERDTFDLFENPDKIITHHVPREDGDIHTKDKERRKDKESSRKDKSHFRKDKLSSSSRRDKDGKKERHKLDAARKLADRKFAKVSEREKKEKLNIFKKNMILKKSDKIAKRARLKLKREREMEQEELDVISSDEFLEEEIVDLKPDLNELSLKSRGRRGKESPEKHLTIRKSGSKEKSPLTIPQPKISPKFGDLSRASGNQGVPSEVLPKKKRGRPKKVIPGMPQVPALNIGATRSPIKMARISKKLHQTFGHDMSAFIPEISITKPPPPPADFPKMIERVALEPGLFPSSFATPPSSRKSQNIPPSISITPATPGISSSSSPLLSKERASQSLPLPSSVCSSVTITRIDMSNSQKLPSPYDNSSTPGIGTHKGISITPTPQQTQKSSASNLTIQADANSGITITPIVMDKGGLKAGLEMEMEVGLAQPEREKGSALAKLEQDFRTKEERKRDREKRKELKKEKKKERKEKERIKSVGTDKGDKKEKKRKAESLTSPPEGLVPKITLKLHSNTNTPVDSPNPPQRFLDDRNDTPPPARKFSIKASMEDFVKKRTPSPELARFSPLVTRPPKSNKVSPPTKSSSVPRQGEVVSFPPSVPGSSKRGPGRPPKSGSGRGPGRPPKTSQAGLVTETVGYYIDDQGTKVWICPSCGRQDDGSPMIGCDTCDDWYHFTCVGITDTPDEQTSWFCKKCIKKSGTSDHRKKGPKL